MPESRKRGTNNLPIQLTSFVGREREIVEITRALESHHLVTLTGAGGAGKTRLALQVATGQLTQRLDGVYFVEFAALSNPALLAKTIAATLEVPEHPRHPVVASLTGFLRPRSMLLVMDNLEHLLPSCAELVETLLRTCPNLHVLATSREPLRIPGEQTFLVPSLSSPDVTALPSVERLIEYDAVRLFIERATAAQPAFKLTTANAVTVAQVCRYLDGMPLAIELAAARLRALTVDQLVARLDDRFGLLAHASRTAVPRHQTLRAAIEWSYNLLSVPERVLLHRLAVFSGGFTLEAVEGICGGNGTEASQIVDLFMSLADKSLIVEDYRGGETRRRLLETVRQYARERLQQTGDDATIRRQHRDWYLGLVETAAPNLRGAHQGIWLRRLELEHENLRAALDWCATEGLGRPEALRLIGGLFWFWFLHGHLTEGRGWSESALTAGVHTRLPALSKVYVGAAYLAFRQGDRVRANILCEEGLAFCEEVGDVESCIYLLMWWGASELTSGGYADAATKLERGLRLSRELGDKWLTGAVLCQLGALARYQGDYARAAAVYHEGLAVMRETGDNWAVGYALRGLGRVQFDQRRYEQAAIHFAEGLGLCHEMGDRWVAGSCLDGVAWVACAARDFQRAARLLGAAEGLRKAIGLERSQLDQSIFNQQCDAARAGLGRAPFAAMWTEGETMPLDQAIRYALEPILPAANGAKKPAGAASPLARREREVASLIAAGLSNREIAARLVISERTAETHVQHILNKLGVNSRAQIAAWAVQHGLDPQAPE
jgi:predicted ATPase/DNA-binding CsgD family transcriptional regulator